jgi:predicted porin
MSSGDVDETFPKIEAAFGMGFDMFNFKIAGGYQTFEIDDATNAGITPSTSDEDVDSWTIALDVGANFGPGYLKGAVSYSQNPGNAGWHIPGNRTAGGFGTFTAGGDFKDNDVLMFALVGGWKFTDMVSLEAGYGYREDDSDVSGTTEDEAWEAYVQLPLRLAPGVAVIPEFGYTDFKEDSAGDDEGDQWYLGAKWQIDF